MLLVLHEGFGNWLTSSDLQYSLITIITHILYPGTRVISLLLHESKAELRTCVITMISSEYTEYNYFMSQCAEVRDNARRFMDS